MISSSCFILLPDENTMIAIELSMRKELWMENKKPLRILQVIGAMNFGGAESMIMNIYRKIDRSTVQFDFLVHTEADCSFDKEIIDLGGNIYRIRRFNGLNAKSYFDECMGFFDAHPEIKIVHGHIGSCASLYLLAAKKHDCFTIAHSHSVGEYVSIKDYIYSFFSFPTRYISDYLLGCSTEAGIARFGKKVVREKKKYCNYPNAIDLDKYQFNKTVRDKLRSEFGIKPDERLIGAIGRIVDAKNPEFIFDLFKQLVHIPNIKCIWVGYGTLEEVYQKKNRDAGLSDQIIMTGKRSDVPNILQALDCFILPSKYEGLPVSAIEAQAAGLPCILSETITREAEVSNLVSWLPINTGTSVWVETIVSETDKSINTRKSPSETIKEKGYDINTSVKWLEDFYVSHV